MVETAQTLRIVTPTVAVDDDDDPDAIFDLIERAAETIRSLRENEERVAAREQTIEEQLERDRAIWRDDLDTLRRTVEGCLEKAAAAERETAAAKEQTRRALDLCEGSRVREEVAIRRAEAGEFRARVAEERYARLEAFLSKSFAAIPERRRGA